MSRGQLIVAIVASLILAIPMVTFISAMVLFPLVFYGLIGLFAAVGWLALVLHRPLAVIGLRWDYQHYAAKWQMTVIIWTGCAFGFSNWGAVGVRDEPYLKVFFAPLMFVKAMLVG